MFLSFSEPDVPHVVLVGESIHLRGAGGSSNGHAHFAHDGVGGHPRPRGSGSNWIQTCFHLSNFIQTLEKPAVLRIKSEKQIFGQKAFESSSVFFSLCD